MYLIFFCPYVIAASMLFRNMSKILGDVTENVISFTYAYPPYVQTKEYKVS